MSSWLSLTNPFKSQKESSSSSEGEDEKSASVKEDLSELGKTLTRQLWGVASFLAPPPSTNAPTISSTEEGDSQTLVGIRNDFAEISGSLKSGLSLISSNKAVNQISRLASNILQFNDDDDGDDEGLGSGVVGISEEALEFVREISLRPQCWTDFPLALDDIDFDMSSSQREHASTVEHLASSLADLKMNLCPSNMKEEHFWMIYFILLHPRLHKHDVELLSTAQIVETRDILLQTLQKRTNAQLQTSTADGLSLEVNENGNDIQEERSSVEEKKVFGKTVIAEDQEDLDVDKWLEEDVETGPSFNSRNQLGNEQDVSFSDLEDDDNDTSSSNPAKNIHLSSPNESSGWVQLSENSKPSQPASQEKDSESEESNEWLTVDEFDTESVGTA